MFLIFVCVGWFIWGGHVCQGASQRANHVAQLGPTLDALSREAEALEGHWKGHEASVISIAGVALEVAFSCTTDFVVEGHLVVSAESNGKTASLDMTMVNCCTFGHSGGAGGGPPPPDSRWFGRFPRRGALEVTAPFSPKTHEPQPASASFLLTCRNDCTKPAVGCVVGPPATPPRCQCPCRRVSLRCPRRGHCSPRDPRALLGRAEALRGLGSATSPRHLGLGLPRWRRRQRMRGLHGSAGARAAGAACHDGRGKGGGGCMMRCMT